MNTRKNILNVLLREVEHLTAIMGTDIRVRILESPLRGKLTEL